MTRINVIPPALLLDEHLISHFHRVKIDNDHDFNRYLKIVENKLDL